MCIFTLNDGRDVNNEYLFNYFLRDNKKIKIKVYSALCESLVLTSVSHNFKTHTPPIHSQT